MAATARDPPAAPTGLATRSANVLRLVVEELDDVGLAGEGRVMEVLNEHLCQGWLEDYLPTGRRGLLSCYEAFIHIVDAMFNQHAK